MRNRSKVWSMSKEELEQLVQNSNSIKDLVRKIGLNSESGSNDITVKKCLESHGIDWKPLALRGAKHSHNNVSHRKMYSNKEMFKANSSICRKVVRNRIIKENLLPYKCDICGQEPVWNNKPMTLILDHINGVRNDHRLENLRFVCPNCNMQLETTCGNHNSQRRQELMEEIHAVHTCKKCGKPISRGATYCVECSHENSRKVQRPSKEELLELIQKYPFTQIGSMFNVTDNTIRKWCKKYKLPYKVKDIKNSGM